MWDEKLSPRLPNSGQLQESNLGHLHQEFDTITKQNQKCPQYENQQYVPVIKLLLPLFTGTTYHLVQPMGNVQTEQWSENKDHKEAVYFG